MRIALEMVGWTTVPYYSAIHVTSKKIRKIIMMVDVTVSDLILAKIMDFDSILSHHPIGVSLLIFHRVLIGSYIS
jgi:putative NIF3 family GTP cyclohydrolase 1 type 2